MYDPMTENHWEDYDLRPPSFYGYEVSGLDGLGDAIGADPRFAMCMTRQFGAYLLQVDKEEIPFDQVVAWRDAFVASGLSAQSLVSEIVRSDLFRAVSVTGEDAPPSAGMLVIRPEQYARTLRDLTGFRFVAVGGCEVGACWDKVDLAVTDLYGFRAMSGGIDGFQSTRPVHTATPTKFLAMGKIAAEAAGSVVDADVATADASDRYLLTAIDPGETSEAAIRQQLVLLHDRILGERLDASDEEIDATLALFSAARDRYQGDDVAAWKVTIAALLQDVRVTFY